MEQLLLGQILVNFHLISEADLDRCIAIQRRSDPPQPLGKILVDQGVIEEAVLKTVLDVQSNQVARIGSDEDVSTHELARLLDRAKIDDFLQAARRLGASELFLSSGRKPEVRRNGILADLPVAPLAFARCQELIYSILTADQIESYRRDRSIDVLIKAQRGRYRANVFRHYEGIAAVLRVLRDDVPDFTELGLPDAVREVADFKNGLVLVTGPTGAGKSTTLAALVELINRSRKLHVITFEDPIESVFRSDKSLISQREMGETKTSYADALRAALREDPDVLVVGELRDPETFSAALAAAETGHLVLGTLHTNTAYSTVTRVIDQFPIQRRAQVRTIMASVLRAVVCQELVPSIDGETMHLATEVLLVNPAIANLIRENRDWQIPNIMQMNRNRGMQLMDDSLHALVQARKISIEQALQRATDRARFIAPATAGGRS